MVELLKLINEYALCSEFIGEYKDKPHLKDEVVRLSKNKGQIMIKILDLLKIVELGEEKNIRNFEDLKDLYKKSKENDNLIQTKSKVWEFENSPIRRELLKEADELLSEDKKLAIALYSAKSPKTDDEISGWCYEIIDLERNWEGQVHKKYLNKAIELLKLSNLETLIKIISTIK